MKTMLVAPIAQVTVCRTAGGQLTSVFSPRRHAGNSPARMPAAPVCPLYFPLAAVLQQHRRRRPLPLSLPLGTLHSDLMCFLTDSDSDVIRPSVPACVPLCAYPLGLPPHHP